jgi:hypothetical protein
MPDEADPPRKVYGFKEREFKRDNAPASASPPAPTAKELAMLSTAKRPVPAGQPRTAPTKTDDPNEVFNVLRANRAVEEQVGLTEMEIREIKSRRKRDYWLVLIGGNLAIVGAVAVSGFNPITAIFGLAGFIMFTLGLTWVMWQVMNKY